MKFLFAFWNKAPLEKKKLLLFQKEMTWYKNLILLTKRRIKALIDVLETELDQKIWKIMEHSPKHTDRTWQNVYEKLSLLQKHDSLTLSNDVFWFANKTSQKTISKQDQNNYLTYIITIK